MAKCIYCGAETQLYFNGKPVCLQCNDALEKGRKPPSREDSPTQAQSAASSPGE